MASFQEHAFEGGFINFESPEEYNNLGRYAGLNSSQSSFINLPIPVGLHFHSPSNTSAQEVSVATAFYPGPHNMIPDTIFSSSDSVLFYLHSHLLLATSHVAFERLLSAPLSHPKYREEIVHLPVTSTVLNIIIHVLYGTSPAQYTPTFETLVIAVTQMPRYGIIPKAHITPANPIYDLLLSFAPRHPFELYTLAAQFDLQDLAVSTSAYILSYPLSNISDAMAERMGPHYLKRLVGLYLDRFEAMKRVLLLPPYLHPPSQECGPDEQILLKNAWVLATGCLVWDAKRDLTTHSIQAAFIPIADELTCNLCKECLRQRLRDVVTQWVSVRCTI